MYKELLALLEKLSKTQNETEKAAIQKDIDALGVKISDMEKQAGTSAENAKESKKYRLRAQKAEAIVKAASSKLGLEFPEAGENQDLDDYIEDLEDYLDDLKDKEPNKSSGESSEFKEIKKELKTALKELKKTKEGYNTIKEDADNKAKELREKKRDSEVSEALVKAGLNSRFSKYGVRDITEKASFDEDDDSWSYGGKTLEDAVSDYKESESDFFGDAPKGGGGSKSVTGGGNTSAGFGDLL